MIRRIVLLRGLFVGFALASCSQEKITEPQGGALRPATSVSAALVNGKVAFISTRDGNAEIYAMNSDGSNQTRLTFTSGNELYPAWAPDGHHLAFSLDNNEIYVMNATCPSLAPIRLTNNGSVDTQPAWSSDGSKIAFFSERDGALRQIYVMNADGSGQTNLSNVGVPSIGVYSDEQPHWSPDGTKIAFGRGGGIFGAGETLVMNADGTDKINLTNHSSNDGPLGWSPDGSTILIASNRDVGSYELYVMNADGSGVPVRITNNAFPEYPASWSPDGTKIAFNPNGTGDYEIFVMNPDGSSPVNLSNNPAPFDIHPDWGSQPPAPLPDSDCDGINNIVDTAPATPSTGFSDVSLGGATAGTLVSVPANAEVVIDDVASPRGIRVTAKATGPVAAGARVHISIVGKQGLFKLAVPGTYVLTDPATSTTVAVETAGPAEVEVTLNGAVTVISIADGATATINEITNSSGVLTDVTVSDVTGNAGDVTVDGVPVPPGGPPFAVPELSATLSVKSGKLTMIGSLAPGGATGIDPETQTVTLNAGAYSFVMPDGLRRNPGGVYTFEGTLASAPGVQLKLNVKPPKTGSSSWTFEATASPVSGFVNPVTVSLQIGNVKGSAKVTAVLR